MRKRALLVAIIALMMEMKPLFVLFAACGVLMAAPDAKEILKRSVAVNDADFKALPYYTHLETDTNSKGGKQNVSRGDVGRLALL